MNESSLSEKNKARFNFYKFNAAYFEAMYELYFDFLMDYIKPFDIHGLADCADLIFVHEDIGRFMHEGAE